VTPIANSKQTDLWVFVVFVASGFAALLYQVVWQRALFAIFGINIESVAVVVTAFMFGLGLGSLWGGQLSRNSSRSALLFFASFEAAIGIFGLFSIRIFKLVGDLCLDLNPVSTAVASFVLVLFPTTLMGATLPLLVTHLVAANKNVGRSVSLLYFVNTLGSSLASFAAVLFFMPKLALHGTTQVAAATNLSVAAIAGLAHLANARSSR
jgi:predicted membrane-bound spermidine synthase